MEGVIFKNPVSVLSIIVIPIIMLKNNMDVLHSFSISRRFALMEAKMALVECSGDSNYHLFSLELIG